MGQTELMGLEPAGAAVTLAAAGLFSSGLFWSVLASGFCFSGLTSALVLAENFLGSFSNSLGQLAQQKPTVLPSKVRTLPATTGLLLTGQTELMALAAESALGSAGLATMMASSSPRLVVRPGICFLRLSAPAA